MRTLGNVTSKTRKYEVKPSNVDEDGNVNIRLSYMDAKRVDIAFPPTLFDLKRKIWQVYVSIHNSHIEELYIHSDHYIMISLSLFHSDVSVGKLESCNLKLISLKKSKLDSSNCEVSDALISCHQAYKDAHMVFPFQTAPDINLEDGSYLYLPARYSKSITIRELDISHSEISGQVRNYTDGNYPAETVDGRTPIFKHIQSLQVYGDGVSKVVGYGEMDRSYPHGDAMTHLLKLERDELGFIVYKQFHAFRRAPSHWIIEPGSIINNPVDRDGDNICSNGIHVAPTPVEVLRITGKHSIPIWKCRIRYEWLSQTVFPRHEGRSYKLRTGRLELIEEIPFNHSYRSDEPKNTYLESLFAN